MNEINASRPAQQIARLLWQAATSPERGARTDRFDSSGPLGPGFPSVTPESHTGWDLTHDLLAGRVPNAYGWTAEKLVNVGSPLAQNSLGINVGDLVNVDRKLYITMSPSPNGSQGDTLPLFQALGDQMGAYIDLGPKHASDADHLMREWNSLPLSELDKLGVGHDELTPVRQTLLDRAHAGQFPVYIDMDGDFNTISPTESMAMESIASVAKRENHLGGDFPDTATYYRWLTTRIAAQYNKVDPWLWASHPATHTAIDTIKKDLTPPWLEGQTRDPLGAQVPAKQLQDAYGTFMTVAGHGQAPTYQTLADIADTTVGLDRDLVSGIQTYWIKMLRELGTGQRESLLQPLVRSWVALNTVGKDDPNFSIVSPDDAPQVDMVDRDSGKTVTGPYDRAMSLSQAVDHTLAGLGIQERRDMVSSLMSEINQHRSELESREQRLRAELGPAYVGLDIDGLLKGTVDGNDPGVQKALTQLKSAAVAHAGDPKSAAECAELTRHRDIMDWVANRTIRYGEVGLDVARQLPNQLQKNPLIVSEFYIGNVAAPGKTPSVTPLGQGPSRIELHGKANGQAPTPMSIVLQGGGGKGFAFAECLRQLKASLDKGQSQTAIDEFVGNSAGALTAGLLAAGYDPDELAQAQSQMDFKSFYGDYLWLMGGVDPKVRGVDRTGIFSEQAMYRTMEKLLQAKVPVQGRPVLFRDLPFKLRVTSTLINSDLPDDLRKQLGVGKDGQVVFSSDTTPNMDVAAAISCSAAVPGFFNSPQLLVFRQDEKGQGQPAGASEYRMQMVDGGVVNNFPVHEVSRSTPDEKQAMVVLPAYIQAPNADGSTTSLSTLNFDQGVLDTINQYNDQRYPQLLQGLPQFLDKAKQDGAQRVAIALHLSELKDQQEAGVQGRTRSDTRQLYRDAQSVGFQSMDPVQTAREVDAQLAKDRFNFPEELGLNLLLGRNGALLPLPKGHSIYTIPSREATGLEDLGASALAATVVAGQLHKSKQFEQD